MADGKRDGYHHGSLKESLISQALLLLDEAGPDAVTIRAVARRAQVSHAAPANHFPDRTALLTALATDLFQMFEQDVEQALATGNASCRARTYMEALLNLGLDYPHRYALMWRLDLLDWNDPALRPLMKSLYAGFVQEVATLPKQAGRDPHTLAIALWSMVHGYVGLRMNGVFEDRRDEVSGDARTTAMLDLLLAN